MEIYPTKLNKEGNDPNYEKFIQIYNMVFPISIEEKYVSLVNAVLDYWKYSSILVSADVEIEKTAKEIGRLTGVSEQKAEQKEQYTVELEGIKRQMFQAIEAGNYDLLKKLAEKAEYLSSSIKTIGVGTQKRIDSNRGALTDKHVTANEARQGLESSVLRIQEIMSEIYSLSNGGASRIDSFEINENHVRLIESLDCPAEVKQIFYQKLTSQLKFRVEAFKCFQEYALLIIQHYKNRELDSNIDYDLQKKVGIAANGLSEFELTDKVFAVFKDWSNLPPIVLEDEYLKSLSADMVADFLKNGYIQKEKIEEFAAHGNDREGRTLRSALAHNKPEIFMKI